MCVYELQPASPPPYQAAPGCTDRFNAAPYLGCFEDRNNRRALPYEVHGKGLSAEFCGMKCNQAGYRYFAREWRGQCFCGDYVSAYCIIEVKIENDCMYICILFVFHSYTAHILLHVFYSSNINPIQDYDRYGPASNCNCCGRNVGANKMCVWDGEAGAVAGSGSGSGSGGETVGTPPTEPVPTTTTTTSEAPVITTDAPETTPGSMVEDETSDKNIVDVATGAGDFNTLVAAVEAAGLVDALSSGGPFTVLGKICVNAMC